MRAHVLSLSFVATVAACGGEGDPSGTGPCTDAATICGTVAVPASYAGTPKKIIVGLYDKLPPLAPPNGVAAVIDDPAIAVDMPYAFKAEEVMPAGDWFVYIALYDVTGGEFQPVAGVDYTAETTAKLPVGGAALNLPDMTFALYQP